jgi:hypothetical protein
MARPVAAQRASLLASRSPSSTLLSLHGGRVASPAVSVSGGPHTRARFVTSASAEPYVKLALFIYALDCLM